MRRNVITWCFVASVMLDVTSLCAHDMCGSGMDAKLRIGVSALSETMDPLDGWHYLHFVAVGASTQRLVRINEGRRPVADLAGRWRIDKGGTRFTFYLDPTARFHDGSRVTANDVAISFARHFWPHSPSIVGSYLQQIICGAKNLAEPAIPSGIRAIGDSIVEFTLLRPYPLFLEIIAMPGYGIVKADSLGRIPPMTSGPLVPCYHATTSTWVLQQKHGEPLISLQKIPSTPQLISQLSQGNLDLVLGFADGEISAAALPALYHFERLNNFGTLHLYFNNDRPVLHAKSFRQDLAALLRWIVEYGPRPGLFVEKQFSWLPKGIMPHRYYMRQSVTLTPDDFRSKWGSGSPHVLRIFLRKEYLSAEFVTHMETTLQRAGLQAVVRVEAIATLLPTLHSKQYEGVMLGYFGILSDPDGFLDPLRASSRFRFGIIPSTQLMADLEYVANHTTSDRLQSYGQLLANFEDESYLVPLFRLYFPAIVRSGLVLPDARYRFDLPLVTVEVNEVQGR